MGIIIIDGMYAMQLSGRRFVPWGGAGPHSPIWASNYSLVKKYVNKIGLKPAAQGALAGYQAMVSISTDVQEKVMKRPPIPGGIRTPHLHMDGEIYLLDGKQWKEFSSQIIDVFKAKLNEVKTVSFEQAMEISEAVDTLG